MTGELLLHEGSFPGRPGVRLPEVDVPRASSLGHHERLALALPELPEAEVVRHFSRLAALNLSNVRSMQSSGSCTVKYNPIVNEEVAALQGFSNIHPYQSPLDVPGAIHVLRDLGRWLSDLTGLPGVSLQPAAGAQAQLAGLLMVRRYFAERNQNDRSLALVTSTAHGSNPASAAMAGFDVMTVPHDGRGNLDFVALRNLLSSRVAVLMLTNPNTMGVFEEEAESIAQLLHQNGSLLFLDGANFNALVGKFRVSDFGVDLCQLNLHKTFATPHGGNGPGAGALLVRSDLEAYLPRPVVRIHLDHFDENPPASIGKVRGTYGQFGILLRAYAYIRAQGAAGLKQQAEDAVMNANYLLSLLRECYPPVLESRTPLHEILVSASSLRSHGVDTKDVASRMMDHGYHPPNLPRHLVEDGLLIEPTETETRDSLNAFAEAMLEIASEASADPDKLRQAPETTPVGRLSPRRNGGVPNVAAKLSPRRDS